MGCSEAEDAYGLSPDKNGNEAAAYFNRRTLRFFNCDNYMLRVDVFSRFIHERKKKPRPGGAIASFVSGVRGIAVEFSALIR